MSIIDVWGNSFVPLLAGIPLLILLLFACCACIDKTISAARKSYFYYHYKPRRTARRVRFDCETPLVRSTTSSNKSTPRLSRSGTLPTLPKPTGLMAHSSYLQSNSNYRYNSVVHTDQLAGPSQTRTNLNRESFSSDKNHRRDFGSFNGAGTSSSTTTSGGGGINSNPVFINNKGSRRSSTPTPPSQYYEMRPKSPFESYGSPHVESKRRYSTPSSPTMYAYTPRHEDSNHSSISYLPEVRAYLQFMESDPSSRQRSYSFSGRNSSPRTSSRRSSRSRSGRHRTRSRSPSPYALERTTMAASEELSNYSVPSSFGKYLTPQGSSDQGSFRSPESITPDWLIDSERAPSFASFEDCVSNLSRSSSIRTSFI